MTLEQLIQAGILLADLSAIDSHFKSIGLKDLAGMVHLKAALITLSNVADLEPTLRSTYKVHPEPSTVIKPFEKNLAFAKYLRNKFVGHIHQSLVTKAIEWQPVFRHIPGRLEDPWFMLFVNLLLLETAINTYVAANGAHKLFASETDLLYPPDMDRFLAFLEQTIRGSIAYLRQLAELWTPVVARPVESAFDLEAALKAGRTEFKFLAQ